MAKRKTPPLTIGDFAREQKMLAALQECILQSQKPPFVRPDPERKPPTVVQWRNEEKEIRNRIENCAELMAVYSRCRLAAGGSNDNQHIWQALVRLIDERRAAGVPTDDSTSIADFLGWQPKSGDERKQNGNSGEESSGLKLPPEADLRELWTQLAEGQGKSESDRKIARDLSAANGEKWLATLKTRRTRGEVSDWRKR